MESQGSPLKREGARLSIITVCYNAAGGIEATLKSVESLRFREFEYIVIDGGSKDGTLAIVDRYRHVVTTVISEPDKGIYDAMNKGIALAKGEFLWFLNAQDTVHDPDFLADADWDADFLYGGVVLMNGESEHIRLMPKAKLTRFSSLRGQVCCHQSMIVRRSVAFPYDLRYRIVSDFDWSIRILARPGVRAKLIPRYAVKYELDGISSRNFHRCWKENVDILARNYGAWARPWACLLYGWQLAKRVAKNILGRHP